MSRGFEVRISAAAEQDLRDIVAFCQRQGAAAAATRVLDGLLGAVATLEAHPTRGAVPPELADVGPGPYRQLRFERYRLVYRVSEPVVFVLLIVDSRRDVRPLLERRLFET